MSAHGYTHADADAALVADLAILGMPATDAIAGALRRASATSDPAASRGEALRQLALCAKAIEKTVRDVGAGVVRLAAPDWTARLLQELGSVRLRVTLIREIELGRYAAAGAFSDGSRSECEFAIPPSIARQVRSIVQRIEGGEAS